MTKTILNFYASVETVINGLVSLIVNIFMFAITTLAPLAAPIAPAFSVYKALAERLEAPAAIALAGAIAIEITGMFVSKTAIRAHNWNRGKNKTDPEAPKALAITMTAIFFVVIFILAFTIEINPALSVYVYPGFVIVAITVYVSLAVSNDLAKWETDKAAELELRQEKNGIAADIRRAKSEAAKLQTDLEKMRSEGAKLQSDIDHKQAELKRLADAEQAANSEKSAFIPGNPETLEQARISKKSRIENRRKDVARLHYAGKTVPQIADILDFSPDTIRRDIKALNGQLDGVKR